MQRAAVFIGVSRTRRSSCAEGRHSGASRRSPRSPPAAADEAAGAGARAQPAPQGRRRTQGRVARRPALRPRRRRAHAADPGVGGALPLLRRRPHQRFHRTAFRDHRARGRCAACGVPAGRVPRGGSGVRDRRRRHRGRGGSGRGRAGPGLVPRPAPPARPVHPRRDRVDRPVHRRRPPLPHPRRRPRRDRLRGPGGRHAGRRDRRRRPLARLRRDLPAPAPAGRRAGLARAAVRHGRLAAGRRRDPRAPGPDRAPHLRDPVVQRRGSARRRRPAPARRHALRGRARDREQDGRAQHHRPTGTGSAATSPIPRWPAASTGR